MKKIVAYFGLLGFVLFMSSSIGLMGCLDSDVTSVTDTLYVNDTSGVDSTQGYGKIRYVGSKECESCHEKQYDMFRESGHPYKLNKVVDNKAPTYPSFVPSLQLPSDLSWSDVSYVIGGYGWKARFLDKNGYIHTKDGGNQFNLVDGSFSDYHKDEEKKFDCGTCHTTGYDADGDSQDDLPGIVGSWAAPGIQCEECHGPGSFHVDSKGLVPIKIDRSASSCGSCHYRGETGTIPSSGGFIRHHEQFNEIIHSKKAAMNCVDCHDPHASTRYDSAALGEGVKISCENCHAIETASYKKGSPGMHAVNISCEDCHMAKVSKSAKAADEFVGDVSTHIFRISTSANESQFNEDGSLASSYISLDFACLSCHGDTANEDMPEEYRGKDRKWAAIWANSVHSKAPDFIGAEACAECHKTEYENHQEHGHRSHLFEVNGVEPVFPAYRPEIKLPSGVEWSDVGYLVGGFAWRARFLDSNGYYITAGGNNQYNLGSETFQDYHKDEEEYGYHCASCHTTGYDPTGHNDKPGFEGGTWEETGVMCERCHGPGGDHAGSNGLVRMVTEKTSDLCDECHKGGNGTELRVTKKSEGLFIGRHHYLSNEMYNSKHATIECQTCHDPHASAHYDSAAPGQGIKQTCESCHDKQVTTFEEGSPLMAAAGVKCVDCHMPLASIDGEAKSQWVGDRVTHLFKINPDGSAPQFSADSSKVMPYIGVGFACLSCHADSTRTDISPDKLGWDEAMAGKFAKSVHRQANDVPVKYVGYEDCKVCHEKVYEEWVATDHGHDFRNDTTNNHPGSEAGRDFIGNASCQPCHVTGLNEPSGYNDVAGRVGATHEDSVRLEGIQCETCHGPSSQHAQSGEVKFGYNDVDYKTTCVRCHVGSYDQLEGHQGPADSAGVESHASGLHHPQSLLYYGVDLYEYPGETYTQSAHMTEVVEGCRTCHMFPGTGHDLMVDEEACKDCHADFVKTTGTAISGLVSGHTLEFSYQGKQDSIDVLYKALDSLTAAALTKATDATDSATVKAYFPYKAARYNMLSIKADKSFGIHNYKYISKILKDAIADTARYMNVLP
ncbi:MAG: hypothetical protein HQK83_10655 [Fibrobacteria bacterium]|nr:hypothetical protein [Fibrobacteria bacterium]